MTDNKIPEISIARSYSRKLNLKLYGGNDYEMEDFFASYSGSVLATASEHEQRALSDELYRLARTDVEKVVQLRIKELGDVAESEDDAPATPPPAKKPMSGYMRTKLLDERMKAEPKKTAGEVA